MGCSTTAASGCLSCRLRESGSLVGCFDEPGIQEFRSADDAVDRCRSCRWHGSSLWRPGWCCIPRRCAARRATPGTCTVRSSADRRRRPGRGVEVAVPPGRNKPDGTPSGTLWAPVALSFRRISTAAAVPPRWSPRPYAAAPTRSRCRGHHHRHQVLRCYSDIVFGLLHRTTRTLRNPGRTGEKRLAQKALPVDGRPCDRW